MGWETRFTTTLTFNKETYDSLYKVEDDLEDVNDTIRIIETRLRNLVMMTEPAKFCPKDYDPLNWLEHETKECLEELKSLYVNRFMLSCLKNDWNQCHTENGEPIHPPKEICNEQGDVAFIDGDFILTEKEKEEFNNY